MHTCQSNLQMSGWHCLFLPGQTATITVFEDVGSEWEVRKATVWPSRCCLVCSFGWTCLISSHSYIFIFTKLKEENPKKQDWIPWSVSEMVSWSFSNFGTFLWEKVLGVCLLLLSKLYWRELSGSGHYRHRMINEIWNDTYIEHPEHKACVVAVFSSLPIQSHDSTRCAPVTLNIMLSGLSSRQLIGHSFCLMMERGGGLKQEYD